MWFRKIQKKKKQYALIALIVLFSSAILAGCMSFVVGMNVNVNRYFNECTDLYVNINEGAATTQFESKIKENDKVSIEKQYDIGLIERAIKENDETVNPFYMSVGVMDAYKEYHQCMNIIKGKDVKAPDDNEVWIDSVYSADKKLKIGDTLTISGKKLRITAVFRVATRPSPLFSLSTVYCNQKTYDKVSGPLKKMQAYCLDTRGMNSDQKISFLDNSIPKRAQNSLNAYTQEQLKENVDMMVMLVGGMGVLAAIMVFIAAIVVIGFVIKNCIDEEYRSIGIHKALGDSSNKIKGFYLKSYMFVGGIGILIGSVCGLPIGRLLETNYAKHMEEPRICTEMILVCLASAAILWIVLGLCLFLTLRRIKKITPVEAIRMGMTSSKKKIRKSLIKNANSSFTMAVNEIFKKKGNSIMMFLLLTLSVYLSLFFMSMNYSVKELANNANLWFSVPKADATLTGEVTSDTIKEIRKNKYVKDVVGANLFSTVFKIECVDTDIPDALKNCLRDVGTTVCEDWSVEKTQLRLAQGRVPKKKNEIMMGSYVMDAGKYHVGDYVKLRVQGVEETFLITGTFNTMLNNGNTMSFPKGIYDVIDQKETDYTEYYIYLKNPDNYLKFKKSIKKEYDAIAVEKVLEAIRSSANGVISMVEPVTMILLLVFILFSIVNIIILLEMEQRNNKRQYGVLKALGRTNGYLCLKMYWKVGILSGLAMVIGTVLNIECSGKIFSMFVGVDGLIHSFKYSALILGGLAGTIIFITGMFCIPLGKISPKELMEE